MSAPWVVVLESVDGAVEQAGTRSYAERALRDYLRDELALDGPTPETDVPDSHEAIEDHASALVVERVVRTKHDPRGLECPDCGAAVGVACKPTCDMGPERTVVEYEVRLVDGLAEEIASLLVARPELRARVEHMLRSVSR